MLEKGDICPALPQRNASDMFNEFCDRLQEMAQETNSKDGFFKLQFNLGHLITLGSLLIPLVLMWSEQVANNAVSARALEEHSKALSELTASMKAAEDSLITHTLTLQQMSAQLTEITKTAQQAMIDDDRLTRVQADIKEIIARVEAIEANQHNLSEHHP